MLDDQNRPIGLDNDLDICSSQVERFGRGGNRGHEYEERRQAGDEAYEPGESIQKRTSGA